jgi:hypothetical protein
VFVEMVLVRTSISPSVTMMPPPLDVAVFRDTVLESMFGEPVPS